MNQATSENSVTAVLSRRIKPSRVQDFEVWLTEITREAQKFAGYLGADVIRPTNAAQPEYVTILRFDSYDHLKQWEDSDVRCKWLKRADEMAESDLQLEKITGLEFWFTPPQSPAQPAPPRYKMALILMVVIFLMSIALTPLLSVLTGDLSPLLRTLVLVIVQVILLTYLVMPFVTRLLARWLFPSNLKRSEN